MYSANLRDPLATAFDSMEHALLIHVEIFRAGGWVPDCGEAFALTAFNDQLPQLLNLYFREAKEVTWSWETIEDGLGVMQPGMAYYHDPILRIGSGLLAPDPNSTLASLADRLIHRTLLSFSEDGPSAEERASTMLGYVFEYYVQELLRECVASTVDEQLVERYTLSDDTEPPDACIMGQGVLLVEAKVTRLPFRIDPDNPLAQFVGWLRKLAGERLNQRNPRKALEQGTRFLRKWANGDPDVVAQLGPWDGCRPPIYMIVSLDEFPFLTNMPRFIRDVWLPHLGEQEQCLAGLTCFVSIRELERLAAVLLWHRTMNRPASVFELVSWWMQWLKTGKATTEDAFGNRSLKSGLGDYLMVHYPEAANVTPEIIRSALEEFSTSSESTAFDQGSSR